MFERKCPVCQSEEKHKLSDINLINFDNESGMFDHQIIMACNYCGFVYHEGIDMSLMESHYGAYTGGGQIKNMTEDEFVLNNNMAEFIEHVIHTDKNAKILDVGCGYGWIIDLLIKRGYTNVVGMDTDEALMEKLKEKGYVIKKGSLYSKNKSEFCGKFDVIILKMVMEHLERPLEAVDNVKNWLKENGLLVIEVPDCSLYHRTAFFPGYFQSVNMEHINNYSAISLMNLMYHWRMVACESTESNGIFPVLRMAFRYDKDLSRDFVYDRTDEKIIIESLHIESQRGASMKHKIDSLRNKECAIWGVSAFTRGLLTYTELRNRNIRCFVDQSAYIQSKTLLGKKIIAPTELCGFEGTIVIPGKNSEKAILQNIKELGYQNEIICLSE